MLYFGVYVLHFGVYMLPHVTLCELCKGYLKNSLWVTKKLSSVEKTNTKTLLEVMMMMRAKRLLVGESAGAESYMI